MYKYKQLSFAYKVKSFSVYENLCTNTKITENMESYSTKIDIGVSVRKQFHIRNHCN